MLYICNASSRWLALGPHAPKAQPESREKFNWHSDMKQAIPYDSIWKAIFNERDLIASLLEDFVNLGPHIKFNLSTLETFPANFVTPALDRRESDMCWRFKLSGRWFYVYLLLEFQSKNDKTMPMRMNTYAALLLEKVCAAENISGNAPLPPILPIVLYNGDPPWTAKLSLRDMFGEMPEELLKLQPEQKCLLLDVKRLNQDALARAKGFAAYFFRAERVRDRDDAVALVRDMIAHLQGPEHDRIRRIIRNYLACIWHKQKWDCNFDNPMPMEEFAMLEETTGCLYDIAFYKGMDYVKPGSSHLLRIALKKEREKGIEAGIAKGRKEGRMEGRVEGHKEGREEGIGAALLRLLSDRFGSFPNAWKDKITAIKDSEIVLNLLGEVYKAQSLQEYDQILSNAVKK